LNLIGASVSSAAQPPFAAVPRDSATPDANTIAAPPVAKSLRVR